MARSPDPQTRVTLLGRLRATPNDAAVWTDFVDWCGPHIRAWCRAWGLQDSDAQDVTQDVFLNLSKQMSVFSYDPGGSFRAWLKTLTRRAWQAYATKQKKAGRGAGNGMGDGVEDDRLATLEARDDLARRLQDAFDLELLSEAARLVQLRVEPRTWQAFSMMAFDGCSGADVAAKLEMKVATVFVARSKVQRMVREELARLDHD